MVDAVGVDARLLVGDDDDDGDEGLFHSKENSLR
jgi:hypothetical protein